MKLQFVSPKMHGILDYIAALGWPIVARALGFSEHATRVIDAGAGTIAAQQMLTKNEVGLVKVVPMKSHLVLDALCGAGLIGCAVALHDVTREERCAVCCLGSHLLLMAAVTRPGRRPDPIDRGNSASPMARFATERRPDAAMVGSLDRDTAIKLGG